MWTEDRVLPPMTFVCCGEEVQPEVRAMLAALEEVAAASGVWGAVLSVGYDCAYEERQPIWWLHDREVEDGLPEGERARAQAFLVERLAPSVLRRLYNDFFAASFDRCAQHDTLELHLVMVRGAVSGVLLLRAWDDPPCDFRSVAQMLFVGGLAHALPVFWSVPAMTEVEALFDAAVDSTLDVVVRLATRLPKESETDLAGDMCDTLVSVIESSPRSLSLRAVDLGAFLQSRGRGLSPYPLEPVPRLSADRLALPVDAPLEEVAWSGTPAPYSAMRNAGRADRMVGSVVWDDAGSASVLLVRRRDGAITNAPLPDALARRLGCRDRAGVRRHGGEIRRWVVERLSELEFVVPPAETVAMVREIAEPEAVLGGVRAFGDVVGVELGEFSAA